MSKEEKDVWVIFHKGKQISRQSVPLKPYFADLNLYNDFYVSL